MINAWRGFTAKVQRLFRLLVLFCVLRIVVGVAAIALFERDAIAWGPELTIVVLAIIAVYVAVALLVRRSTVMPNDSPERGLSARVARPRADQPRND